MGEFDLKNGRMGAGVLAMLGSAAAYMLIPYFLLAILPRMFGDVGMDSPTLQVANLAIILGLPVAAASFFRGYYAKGTRSSLAFGASASLLAVIYYYAVLLSGAFREALSHEEVGTTFPLQLFAIGALWQALRVAGHLGAYSSNREAWLKSNGMEAKVKARPPRMGLAEFALANGDFSEASMTARRLTLRFAMVPAFLVMALWLSLHDMPHGTSGETTFLAALGSIAWTMLLFGYAIAPLGWLIGLYPRGTISRLAFGAGLSLVLFIYIYMLLIGSGLQAALEGVAFRVDVGLVLLLLLLVAATVPLRCLGEFVDRRRPWKKRNGIQYKERPLDPERRVMDVHPRIGSLERAALGARSLLLRSMVVPVIAVVIAMAFLTRSGDSLSASLADILAEEAPTITAWAIPLVVLGFARGFYPLGSLGRMSFGLLMSLFIALYLHALLLGGALEAWLAGEGIPLDLDLVWLFLLVLVGFHAAMQLSELADHRRPWKTAIGRKVPEIVEADVHPLFLDFRPRYGRCVSGTKEARKAGRRYLVIPAIAVLVAVALLHKLSSSLGAGELDPIVDSLGPVYDALLVFALPLIVLTFFRGFYPKGSFSRLTFGWLVAISMALWIWVITNGGRLATDLGMERVNVGIELDISGLILVFMGIELLWGFYYLAEYLSYRKDWIANRYLPVHDREVRPRDRKEMAVRSDQAGQ